MLEVWKDLPISKLPQSDSEEDRVKTTARRASGEKTNQHGCSDNKENIDDQESEGKEPRRAKPTAGRRAKPTAGRRAKPTAGKESKCTVKQLVRYLKIHRDFQPHRIRNQSNIGCHCDVQGVMMYNRKPQTVPESPRTDAVVQQGTAKDQLSHSHRKIHLHEHLDDQTCCLDSHSTQCEKIRGQKHRKRSHLAEQNFETSVTDIDCSVYEPTHRNRSDSNQS